VAPAPAQPTALHLPSIGVDAVVVPVGVQDDGQVEVPRDVATAGWYRFGPLPGAAAGSAVIVGHVDEADQGPGAFATLGDLQPGDRISVDDANGATRSWTVLAREQWSKGEVPLDRLFDRAGAPRLVLLTCGGQFDEATLGYDDNIAITAVPDPA
jgi:sortase (surface protein transpeptidase)